MIIQPLSWLGLVGVLVTILVLAGASALLAAIIVEDKITEPIRKRIWSRFPRTGQGLPLELDEGWQESSGTFLGDVIACVRCAGVWTTGACAVVLYAVNGIPADGTASKAVLGVATWLAACQLQRYLNARTSGSIPR